MKNTIWNQKNQIHKTKEEAIEEGEVNFLSPVDPTTAQILWKSTEIRKQEMRERLSKIDPQWVEEYMARNLEYIIDTSIAEWWSKNLQVAIKWLENIAKLMWYTETNQNYTIKSNIPIIDHTQANTW